MTDQASEGTIADLARRDPTDLSPEIASSLDREFDERVRVVRVFDDCYRCNWWVQDTSPHPFWIVAGTIRRSRFVRADMNGGRLRVQ
jgi:hypothetical protein